MEHLFFLVFNFVLFLAILYLDKERFRDYVYLAVLGLILSFVLENLTTFAGLWQYHSEPKILLISLYTWLLYVPYLGFCYFISNKVVKRD